MDKFAIEYVRDCINTGVGYVRWLIGGGFTVESTLESEHSRLLIIYHDTRFPTEDELKMITHGLGIGSVKWNLISVDDGLPDAFSVAASVPFDVDDGGLATTKEYVEGYDK